MRLDLSVYFLTKWRKLKATSNHSHKNKDLRSLLGYKRVKGLHKWNTVLCYLPVPQVKGCSVKDNWLLSLITIFWKMLTWKCIYLVKWMGELSSEKGLFPVNGTANGTIKFGNDSCSGNTNIHSTFILLMTCSADLSFLNTYVLRMKIMLRLRSPTLLPFQGCEPMYCVLAFRCLRPLTWPSKLMNFQLHLHCLHLSEHPIEQALFSDKRRSSSGPRISVLSG